MSRTLTVAALQLPLNLPDERENIAAVGSLVEQAAKGGAQVSERGENVERLGGGAPLLVSVANRWCGH